MMLWYSRCLQHALQVEDHLVNLFPGCFISLLASFGILSSGWQAVHKRKNNPAQEELSVLQTQCGLGASLSSVVRRIWLANLAESSILTQNFSRCERAVLKTVLYDIAAIFKYSQLHWM